MFFWKNINNLEKIEKRLFKKLFSKIIFFLNNLNFTHNIHILRSKRNI